MQAKVTTWLGSTSDAVSKVVARYTVWLPVLGLDSRMSSSTHDWSKSNKKLSLPYCKPSKASIVLLAACYVLALLYLAMVYKAEHEQGALFDGETREGVMLDYFSSAQANLSIYKTKLLSQVAPEFNNRHILTLWDRVFKPIITCPPGRPLTKYGGQRFGRLAGDGAKMVCKLPKYMRRGTCVIYSLGSNGDYSFELSMIKETSCEVHTFDCSYKIGTSQHHRHFHHPWCVGDPARGPGFKTWTYITRALNHTSIDLLKMDIEGSEYSVISRFRPVDALPAEIAMEFHIAAHKDWPATAAELSLAFLHMAELGYATYAQEVNKYAPTCCCEFSFMRLVGNTTNRALPGNVY